MPLGSDDIRELAPFIPEGLPLGLRNYWYPVLPISALPVDKVVGLTLLGEALVVWRNRDGKPCVVRDRCPHRGVKLSLGRVLDGDLQCILHGLRFDGAGRCVLIPWKNEGTREPTLPAVAAYPAQDLGGYVWAYLGDAAALPPPPLESEVPEELSRPDEFVWFLMPPEIWKTNWLLAIDGSDAYHAVTLHATSQAVVEKKWSGGAIEEVDVPLADRRVRIVKTSHGIRALSVDKDGHALHHGHFTSELKGDRFVLPCLHSNPIVPAPGAAPYTSRQWQIPIDETHTQVLRIIVWRATTEAERENAKRVFTELAVPRLNRVSAEDAMAAEAQGDVIAARKEEYLLTPDADLVKIRRTIQQAFLAPGRDGKRIAVPAGALVYPL